MDNYQALRAQIRIYLFLIILLENILLVGGFWMAVKYLNVSLNNLLLLAYGVSVLLTIVIALIAADYVLKPLKALWQAIIHLSPNEQGVAAPDINKLVVGQPLVANLTAQIYQIVTVAEHSESLSLKRYSSLKTDFIANNLPLPLIVLDSEQSILFIKFRGRGICIGDGDIDSVAERKCINAARDVRRSVRPPGALPNPA